MNRPFALFAVALLLTPFLGLAQNRNKGLSRNRIEVATTIREADSPYESSRHNCYAIAVSATGPFIDSTLNTLSFPDNDSREFFTAVQRQFRFKYRIRQFDLLDLENSRRVYRQAADLLADVQKEPVQEGDVVLMYFSGHGLTIDGRYHFPLSDSDVGAVQRMLTGAEILAAAENFANRGANVLLFLDTCEAGSIENEELHLTGSGGVACFPASSAVTSTQERLAIGSSVFGERLKGILSGEINAGDDALTAEAVGGSLTPVLIGNVTPKYYDSAKSDIGGTVLVDNLNKIKEYNRALSTYDDYIRKGQQAVSQKRFHEALAFYGSADELGKAMYREDVLLLHSVIQDLNRQIKNACLESSDSDVWRFLSSIDTDHPLLDLSEGDLVNLFLGCGSYYKSRKDLDNAYRFFRSAEAEGDHKDAPFEIYQITEGGNVPSYKPVTESEREDLLMVAAKNHNKAVSKKLDQDGVLKDVFKRMKYAFVGEEVIPGIALTSGIKQFPFGVQADVFWGLLHLGVDAGFGGSISGFESGKRTEFAEATLDGNVFPLIGYNSTNFGKNWGRLSYSITPGIFYKYVSLDCGFGLIQAERIQTDTYIDSFANATTNPETITGDITKLSLRLEESIEKNSYFIVKPGLTFIVPWELGDSYLYLGARYRICPKDKDLNGFECSLGVTIPI